MAYKLAYICSPLSAPTHDGIVYNMARALELTNQVKEELGCKAVAPHAYLPNLLDDNDPKQRVLALRFGMEVLALCDVLVIGSNRISVGMAEEIKQAVEQNIPIFIRRQDGAYHPPGRLPSPEAVRESNGWQL